MEYEMKNGVLVQKVDPTPICVFVDETYLLDQSGFLQSAIPVPQNLYTAELVPHSQALLLKLGKDAKEFKGTKIKAGNAAIYQEFLQGFINVTARVGDHFQLFPIVAIDATDVYYGGLAAQIYNDVTGCLARLEITDEDHLASEFSRQILWLHIHYPHVAPDRFANHLVFSFDNKHRYAQRMQALRAFIGNQLVAPTFWQLEKAMRSMANTLFEHLQPKIAISKIDRFHFQWSTKEFGLQAADLFCHLMYNAIQHELGIINDNTTLKTTILKNVMSAFGIDANLKAALHIAKDHEGKDYVRCIDSNLRSRIQFLPS
jgi:hypothetical protein